MTLAHTGLIGRQTLQRELDELREHWTQYETELTETEANLQTVLSMWVNYETTFEQLSARLKGMESSVKEFGLVNSLHEKRDQWSMFKVCFNLLSKITIWFDCFHIVWGKWHRWFYLNVTFFLDA